MKNLSLTPNRLSQINELEQFVSVPDVQRRFHEAGKEVAAAVSENNIYSVIDLDMKSLTTPPPELVGTIRIAAFQPGTVTEYERHPNSVQFLYILQGTGETRVMRDDAWHTDSYGEIRSGALSERWHLVEAGEWHRSAATGDMPLVVAALHTAKNVQDEYRDFDHS
jgi:mannose-6-phosphate isomerase-like protein (cupin superfamily)